MTAPDQPAQSSGSQQQGGSSDRPRFRAGQTVAFSFTDEISRLEQAGHALILKVLGEVAHLAVLGNGGGHVQAPVDALTPVSVADVPNPLPAPAEAEAGS